MSINNLLSGLIGALFATILSAVYQYASEQAKYRGELLIEVVNWLDEFYVRLQAMQVHKERIYGVKIPSLTFEEYKMLSEEVRRFLLSEKIASLVALTYGEGRKLQCVNALQGEMIKVARILWASNEKNWQRSYDDIMGIFTKRIDPIKSELLRKLLKGAKMYSVLFDAFRVGFPTLCNLFGIKD